MYGFTGAVKLYHIIIKYYHPGLIETLIVGKG